MILTTDNVQSGDNCNLIESKFSISFCDFLHWNPEVSTTCSNLNLASYCVGISDLQVGQNLCIKNSHVPPPPVGMPANLNPGSWSNCSMYCSIWGQLQPD
ncbi:hypothetical protein C8J57DRAFT_499387 [Mycena rebaudengoi]|nr:hypothetical protein C8J57DRAFT_499387 [Mycena rebaudengoi]